MELSRTSVIGLSDDFQGQQNLYRTLYLGSYIFTDLSPSCYDYFNHNLKEAHFFAHSMDSFFYQLSVVVVPQILIRSSSSTNMVISGKERRGEAVSIVHSTYYIGWIYMERSR